MSDLQSGKGHKDENFPVASFIIRARHRAALMAFYRFARTADDISDHPTLPAADKLAQLELMRATLTGERDDDPSALALRLTQQRYADWADLIDYCRYSAMPVGRFVLDVHGEARTTWPASDALCAALQVINHLQDCGRDYLEIDRFYLPEDVLAAHGASAEMLGAGEGDPALRAAIRSLAERTQGLLAIARPFAGQVRDLRLA